MTLTRILPRQDCHPERSEGSALKRPTTGDRRPRKKQILRRCAPQNDTATESLHAEQTVAPCLLECNETTTRLERHLDSLPGLA